MRPSGFGFILALMLLFVSSATVDAEIRVRTLDGSVFEGRVYDLGNEYLELENRVGSNQILKRMVKSWRQVVLETPESPGIILVFQGGHAVSGNVRFDVGTREWVVDLELGSARYPDSEVKRTIQPNGICSDDRFTVRADFEDRINRAIAGVRSGEPLATMEGLEFLRAAGFFAKRFIEEALVAGNHETLREILLEERLRMALPEGVTESRPHFLKQISTANPKERVNLLREALLENGSDLYPLLGLLLLDESQSSEVRTFAVDVLQRTHSIKELLLAWKSSQAHAQLALAIALGENGVYIGITTLIDALELDEEAARAIAAEKLLEYTGEQFGFESAGDAAARAGAVKLWREWWTLNKDEIEKIAVSAFRGDEVSHQRRRASDLWRQGIESEARGRFDAAEHFYRNATQVDPTAMGPFVSLGILLYQQRTDFEGALTSFRRALGRDAGRGDEIVHRLCYYHIGRIYQLGLDFDRSRIALLKAIQLDPNYSAAWYELGRNLYEEALLDSGEVEQRRKQLIEARDTFENGIKALVRYREGMIVLDRTNLPFDSALPFSTRDHNRTLRELRARILEELGRFRGRIAAISLVLGDPRRVFAEHKAARAEGSLNDELELMLISAQRLQQESEPQEGEPVPSGGVVEEENHASQD